MKEHNLRTLASIMDVDGRRVQQLAKEGIVKQLGRGRYDLRESVVGYIRYLRKLAAPREAQTSLAGARLRRANVDAETAEFDLAQLRRKVIPVEEVRDFVSTAFLLIRGQIESSSLTLAEKRTLLASLAAFRDHDFQTGK